LNDSDNRDAAAAHSPVLSASSPDSAQKNTAASSQFSASPSTSDQSSSSIDQHIAPTAQRNRTITCETCSKSFTQMSKLQ
jgi:hypothetical protein